MAKYRTIMRNRKVSYEHRAIVGEPDGLLVHHKDGDIRNNARENLEVISASDHKRLHNYDKVYHSRSGWRGVVKTATGRYSAKFDKNYKRWQKDFNTAQEAALWYNEQAMREVGPTFKNFNRVFDGSK